MPFSVVAAFFAVAKAAGPVTSVWRVFLGYNLLRCSQFALRVTSTALRRWQMACYDAFRARTLVARAVALWRQLDVARAMSSWRQRAAVHRRTRTALSRHLKLDVRRAVAQLRARLF